MQTKAAIVEGAFSMKKVYVPYHETDVLYCRNCHAMTTQKRIAVYFETKNGREFITKWTFCLDCMAENETSKSVESLKRRKVFRSKTQAIETYSHSYWH
jgi:hypothetical protein